MACACQKGPDGQTIQFTAVLPGGKTRKYNSRVARDAIVQQTEGAYALPDPEFAPQYMS